MNIADTIPEYKGHLKQEVFEAVQFSLLKPTSWLPALRSIRKYGFKPISVGSFYRCEFRGELVSVMEWDNLVTTNGKNYFLQAATGSAARVLNNAQGGFLIGDGTTAAAVGDTNLAGTNKYRQGFDPTYPQTSGNVTTIVVTVASANANFNHSEYGLTNASTTALSDGVLITRLLGGPLNKTTAWVVAYTYTLTQS